MKKTALLLCLGLIALFFFNGCGGGKYSDAIRLNQEYIGLVESYVNDLEKSNNAKDAAKAMNRFADGLEKVWPRMKKMSEKYPELKDRDNTPEELMASQKEADAMGYKMGGAMRKVMPYMGDPEVRKAQQRIAAIMQS